VCAHCSSKQIGACFTGGRRSGRGRGRQPPSGQRGRALAEAERPPPRKATKESRGAPRGYSALRGLLTWCGVLLETTWA